MKLLAENKKINFLYNIHEKFEAGLVLYGDEVKSIKNNSIDIKDAYIKIIDSELYAVNMKISKYKKSNINTIKHALNRNIKLLLTQKEIKKLDSFLTQKKYTCVVSKILLKNNLLKSEIVIVSGKKKFDKKEDLKNRDIKKDIQRKYKLHI